jgi:phospholipid/cholesterol/gamma-HCH transport system permease protein
MRMERDILRIEESLDRRTVPELYKTFRRLAPGHLSGIDLGGVDIIDSAGVAFLETLRRDCGAQSCSFYLNTSPEVRADLDLFALSDEEQTAERIRASFLVSLGDRVAGFLESFLTFMLISSNIFTWSVTDLFLTRYRRRGEVAKQSILIGLDAVPIVGLLSLIIGLILALQSAAQLRQFGAGIFVVDLIAISMVREMGPMITSILIAGRSGSAIAAEIATMKVTEELDALRIMALEPVRYVIVPKMLAISICLPLLVGISIMVGISAGMMVSYLYLDISFLTFANQVFEVLRVSDIVVGLGKSFFFGWIILFVSSYFGMTTTGGAEGVGAATTNSVVGSIFGVIALDALFSFTYLA